tara:strand:- start:139 stop:792 length:654 start_codon:yes stop_codon:yes gene_type:complete
MSYGYLYCFSNHSYPGILKVGMTERTPEQRIKELFKTGVPSPFHIECAIKVSNPKKKESVLHKLLTQYTDRTDPNREFFKVSVEEIKTFFELIDGEYWVQNNQLQYDSDPDNDSDHDNDDDNDNDTLKKNKPILRELSKCFTHNQRIKHTIGINKTWTASYDANLNVIIHQSIHYKSISGFANAHHQYNGTYKHNGVSGWTSCYCEIDNQWYPTSKL